jgi:hypothetical protein
MDSQITLARICNFLKDKEFIKYTLLTEAKKRIESTLGPRTIYLSGCGVVKLYHNKVIPNHCQNNVLGLIQTIHELHSAGWVHLDIRWPNIIFGPLQKEFFLIDSGCAHRIEDPLPLNLQTLQKIRNKN